VLSRWLLGARFNRKHLIGAVACLSGLGLLVASDFLSARYGDDGDDGSAGGASNAVLGDVLVLLGTVLYAISNIGQERFVKAFDWMELLSMYGLCGALVSGIQMAIVDRHNLQTMDWTGTCRCTACILSTLTTVPAAAPPLVLCCADGYIWLYLFGFDACLFTLYTATPLLLQHSSAVFMNLSFLTSDFWALLIAVFVFGARLHFLYFIAFAVIVCGLVLYNIGHLPHCQRDGGGAADTASDQALDRHMRAANEEASVGTSNTAPTAAVDEPPVPTRSLSAH
jgi:solute carrier family 35, member F1/2